MVRSMTGFASVEGVIGSRVARLELRAVNGKSFKLVQRVPESLSLVEGLIEAEIRKYVKRGNLTLAITGISAEAKCSQYVINQAAFKSVWKTIKELSVELGIDPSIFGGSILSTPGVISNVSDEQFDFSQTADLESLIAALMLRFNEFRTREGSTTATEVLRLSAIVSESLGFVVSESPKSIGSYRERLLEKSLRLAESIGCSEMPPDLIREIAVIADKCDVNEEVSRLGCHLNEFANLVNSVDCEGRKLDFMCQEIFREINTIGSKANDFEISKRVIAMKSATEQIRELVQNIE